MGDHLGLGVHKLSRIAYEISCLAFPTDDTNCGLLNFLNRFPLKHEPASEYLQNKQENDGGLPAVSPMLKLDSSLSRVKTLFFSVWNHVPFSSVISSFLSRRKVILFPWKVEDFLPKRKGKVVLFSCVMTCYSF